MELGQSSRRRWGLPRDPEWQVVVSRRAASELRPRNCCDREGRPWVGCGQSREPALNPERVLSTQLHSRPVRHLKETFAWNRPNGTSWSANGRACLGRHGWMLAKVTLDLLSWCLRRW